MSAGGSGGGSSGGGGGSRFGGNGGGEMEIQEDTIFVQGLGPSITQEDLVSHFGSIGIIKVRRRLIDILVPGFFPDQFYRVGREVKKKNVFFFFNLWKC